MDLHAFAKHLEWAEGNEQYPYADSRGFLTIGVGRNLDEHGLTKKERSLLLKTDIQRTVDDCRTLGYWDTLDSVRQLVVADMVFNLGLTRFLKFVKMNAAMASKDHSLAAVEMKDSRWFGQVGRRAEKLVKAMVSGEWDE